MAKKGIKLLVLRQVYVNYTDCLMQQKKPVKNKISNKSIQELRIIFSLLDEDSGMSLSIDKCAFRD